MTAEMRLAFREEGGQWNCYVGEKGTMDGALWMGGIAIGLVSHDSELKQAFMDLMKLALDNMVKSTFGVEVTSWNEPESAPESERSGSA